MALRHFQLALRIFLGSLAALFIWLLLLSPWLRSRGQEVPSAAFLLVAALVGSSAYLGWGLHRAARGLRMTAFRIRYTLDEGGLPPGFADFLENLAREAGHIVASFILHRGHLGLYLEVPAEPGPDGYAPVVQEAVCHPSVLAGEARRIGTLKVRPLKVYAALVPASPRRGRGERRSLPPGDRHPNKETVGEEGEPKASLGRAVLEALLRHGGNGEVRWHLTGSGGILTVAAERPEVLQKLSLSLPGVSVLRIPRLVHPVPPHLWPPLARILEAARNLYWWCPVYADWEGGLARRIFLPPSAEYPDLDIAQVRFPLPDDYDQPEPVLVLGHTVDGKKLPVGLSLSTGVETHLLVLGGGPAQEDFQLALVEQALRLGMGAVAIGDRFDGRGAIVGNLPAEKRELVLRISPRNLSRLSLLNPGGRARPPYQSAALFLERFLEAEGISSTANPDAVRLCQAAALFGLAADPAFSLAGMLDLLEQAPGFLRPSADLLSLYPADVRAFLEENSEYPSWKMKAHAALVRDRLSAAWEEAAQPPYVNLSELLAGGGGIFFSYPLAENAANARLARYVLYSVLHLLLTESIPRPVLLCLADFPLYLTLPLPWHEMRARGCLVVQASASLPEAALRLLPANLSDGGFASLLLALPPSSRERAATLLGLPEEVLDLLRGRRAVLQHLHRGSFLTCSVDVLAACPPTRERFTGSWAPPCLSASPPEESPPIPGKSREKTAFGEAAEEQEAASVPPEAPGSSTLAQTRARLSLRRAELNALFASSCGRVENVGEMNFPTLPPEEE